MTLIKAINDVRLYKEINGRHYYIYKGEEYMGSDIWKDAAEEKFNKVVLKGYIVEE